jgi:hypothetical protein
MWILLSDYVVTSGSQGIVPLRLDFHHGCRYHALYDRGRLTKQGGRKSRPPVPDYRLILEIFVPSMLTPAINPC